MKNEVLTGTCQDCGLEYPIDKLTDVDDSGALRTLCPGCIELLKMNMKDKSKSDLWGTESDKKLKPVEMSDIMPEAKKDDGIIRARCQRCGIEYPIDELIEIDDNGVLRKLCPLCNSVRLTDAKIAQMKNQDVKAKKELERAKKIKERNAAQFEKEKKKKFGIAIGIAVAILAVLIVVTVLLT